jgi:hypothetical protein
LGVEWVASLLYNALQRHRTRSYHQAVAVWEDLMAMEGNEEMATYFTYPEGWAQVAVSWSNTTIVTDGCPSSCSDRD